MNVRGFFVFILPFEVPIIKIGQFDNARARSYINEIECHFLLIRELRYLPATPQIPSLMLESETRDRKRFWRTKNDLRKT